MPVLRAGAAGVAITATGTSQSFTLPAGAQQGDLIVIWLVGASASNSFSSPFFSASTPTAGAGGSGTIQTLTKLVTGDLPGAQYPVTATSSDVWGGVIFTVGNEDQSIPVDGGPSQAISSSNVTTVTANSVTSNYSGDLVVWLGMVLLPTGTNAITVPGGYTAQITQVSSTIPSATNVSFVMATSNAAGATGASGAVAGSVPSAAITGATLITFPNPVPAFGVGSYGARRRYRTPLWTMGRHAGRRAINLPQNTGTQFPLVIRQSGRISMRAPLRINRQRVFTPPWVVPSPFIGWSFGASGTPGSTWFIMNQANVPPIAVGQTFFDTLNPGVPFLISWISAPAFGFVNVNFTPPAANPMNNGDIVTQANMGPVTLWPSITQSVRKPLNSVIQASRMVRRSRVIAPGNLAQGQLPPVWTPPAVTRPGWRRFAPLLRRGRAVAPVAPQGAQGTPAIMTVSKQRPRPWGAYMKLPRKRVFAPPWPQGRQATGTPAIMRPATTRQRPWALRKLLMRSRIAMVPIPKQTQKGSAHFTAATTLSAPAHITHPARVALSQGTKLTVSGSRSRAGSVHLQAATKLKVIGSAKKFGVAALSAATTLTARGVKTRRGTVTLTASTTLTATASRSRSVVLSAATKLTVAGTATHNASAALSAATVLKLAGAGSLASEEILIVPQAVPGVNEPGIQPPIISPSPVTQSIVKARVTDNLFDP